MHTISMSQRLEPPERDWMDDFAQAGGGAILNTGIHLFDLLRFLSGDEVQHVYCETARIFYEEFEDSCVATMRLRLARSTVSWMWRAMLAGALDALNWSGRPGSSWATSIMAMP